jgi:F0F1-type ATP synthase membrane subunit b/b'
METLMPNARRSHRGDVKEKIEHAKSKVEEALDTAEAKVEAGVDKAKDSLHRHS